MSTRESAVTRAQPVKHKRRLRNYLLNVGLQLRYTSYIAMVAATLTAGLGYKMWDATRDTSKVIGMTSLVDPAIASELQAQFASNDRIVLWGIVGFGVLLLLSVTAVGILITHKVAGPLFKISAIFRRVRDNQLAPAVRDLRKGDELVDFYSSFREMHDALRARVAADVRALDAVITSLETGGTDSAAAIEDLRQLRAQKQESLEG